MSTGYKHIHVSLFSPGIVYTEIAKNAIGGAPEGVDFHSDQGQTVEEVAEVVGDIVARPDVSADVYSRAAYKGLVTGYLSAEDVKSVERLPPFATA